MPQKKTKRSTFRFIVDVTPDRDMGLDDPDKVKDLIEEAIRDSGMDNGAKVSVSPPSSSENTNERLRLCQS